MKRASSRFVFSTAIWMNFLRLQRSAHQEDIPGALDPDRARRAQVAEEVRAGRRRPEDRGYVSDGAFGFYLIDVPILDDGR